MNVLLIGSGGREHALAWALSASPLLTKLTCAPGNGGIAQVAECVALDTSDHAAVIAWCKANTIDFVVIGPEIPLVAGLASDLAAAGIKHFGPSKAASQLEGSKGFTKDLCREFSIPTAAYGRFKDAASAKAYLAKHPAPIVVKADGLAAGKGVIMAETEAQAIAGIDACFSGEFGASGAEIVLEEWMQGEEASFFALVDGTTGARPRHGAGPQTRRRRRYRSQHRRHGRLLARARHDAGHGPAHDGRNHPPDRTGHAGARHAVQGRALCGPDDHQGRSQADRIQRPLRRS